MVEEYARHNGQADLLRERIDGAVGHYQPGSAGLGAAAACGAPMLAAR